MKEKTRITLAVALGVFLAAESSFAHHAFGSMFDAQRVHKLKGVVTAFVVANPHGLIFLDTVGANGQAEHWAIEMHPRIQALNVGLGKTALKPGDTLEVCGYATKDGVEPFRSFTPPEPISLSLKSLPRETSTGRLIHPELLTLSTGQKFVWGNQGGCAPPDERTSR